MKHGLGVKPITISELIAAFQFKQYLIIKKVVGSLLFQYWLFVCWNLDINAEVVYIAQNN